MGETIPAGLCPEDAFLRGLAHKSKWIALSDPRVDRYNLSNAHEPPSLASEEFFAPAKASVRIDGYYVSHNRCYGCLSCTLWVTQVISPDQCSCCFQDCKPLGRRYISR